MSINVDLACTASAWVRRTEPDANYHGASIYPLAGPGTDRYYTYLLLKFEDLPQQYRYYSVIDAQYWLTVNKNLGSSRGNVTFSPLTGDFDEETVTYSSVPTLYYLKGGTTPSQGSGDEQIHYIAATTTGDWSAAVPKVMAYRTVAVYMPMSWTSDEYFTNAYTEQAAAGNRPFLRLVLSDTPVRVNTTIIGPNSSTELLDNSSPVTFSWSYSFASSVQNPIEPIVQTGATIYWKESDSTGNYNAVTVTGSEPSYTFPAGTFPAKEITWYVEPTLVGYTPTASGNGVAVFRRGVRMQLNGIAGISNVEPGRTYPWQGSATVYRQVQTGMPVYYSYLLVEFEEFPTQYRFYAVDRAALYFRTVIAAAKKQAAIFTNLLDRFDAGTVTWETEPPRGAIASVGGYDNTGSTSPISLPDFRILSGLTSDAGGNYSYVAARLLQSPAFEISASVTTPEDSPIRDSFNVYAPVELAALLLDQTVTSKPAATTNASGYVNPHVAQAFRWQHVPDGDYWCVAGWTTASATLYWRQAGASTWNSVAAAAGSSEVILPAETLPAGSVEWYVNATDDQGTTASSEIYTISTADTLHTATPVYPIDTTENGDAGIRFIWTDASDTGAAPTGADLQYSDDQGATWTDFASPRSSATQYDAPGGGFPPGVLLWRVRSLNAEGTAGPWSEAVSFLCFAAPDPPILDSDGKPFLTVTWQSSGQRAYRVTVDDKTYGPYFGDGKSFSVPEYLSDGSHVVRVEIQNEYGLWNGAEITVTVANVPGSPVILSGSFDRDAALRWTCEDATADFLVYRDDVQIGHSSGYIFTDRTVLDFHTWRVINRLPGGYYTASNTVSGTLCTEGLALALLAGGPWLDLTLSTNAIRTTTAAAGRSVILRQFAGREYPDAEAAPYKTLQISFDVSWPPTQAAQARAFEAMLGEAVIFKEPGEEAFVGVLSAFQRSHSFPARSYTATVQRIHWKEFVNADG